MLARLFSGTRLAATLAASALLAAGGTALADETFSLSSTFAIPSGTNPLGGFASADISFVDSLMGLWMLADRTNKSLDVIDLNFNTVHQIIPTNSTLCPNCAFQGARAPNGVADNEISGPNGVVTVNHREAWVSDAPTGSISGTPQVFTSNNDSSVKVIDLRTQQVTDVLSTGGNHRADEVAFDPD